MLAGQRDHCRHRAAASSTPAPEERRATLAEAVIAGTAVRVVSDMPVFQ
jgi:hypothetical protein